MVPGHQSGDAAGADSSYVVIARRYRPQGFGDLIGQQMVAGALRQAIESNRVGHAYLFTGARGVGKTSTARILAKALNCQQGPTPTPCDKCDICQSIVAGEDVDVLEIDGASNRGIDEIRQLRSNVNVRPSRSRFKIYIIDEVHMLTTPAFNALLKTLEEPPEHVKFIFCTTDPEKIPITVLSRCQRFDFAPVQTESIADRLRYVVEQEQFEADEDALRLLARRAAGSMRDSQSLLEQLLAVCEKRITLEDVHRMLGTAPSGRLEQLTARLIERDAAGALAELDAAVADGVDIGQLAEQLMGYFRDMMAVAVGCPADVLLHVGDESVEQLKEVGQSFGLETILAALQILDQTLVRLRTSTHVRALVEVAVVRICRLENLEQVSTLIGQLQAGVIPPDIRATPLPAATPPPAARSTAKSPAAESSSTPVDADPETATADPADSGAVDKPPPAASDDGSDEPPKSGRPKRKTAQKKTENPAPAVAETISGGKKDEPLNPESIADIWQQALADVGDVTADFARCADSIAISAPNRLVATFPAGYTLQKESCERPERKIRIEEALSRITGRTIRIDLQVAAGKPVVEEQPAAPPRRGRQSMRESMREAEKHPLVQQAIELFDAELVRVDAPPRRSTAQEDPPANS